MMKKTFFILIGLIYFIIISVSFTADTPPGFKNLKILPKNISEHLLDSIMENFSVSLGVKCEFCHVHNETKNTWDMVSDANPDKLIARKMMLMMNGINAKYFPAPKGAKDQQLIKAITCYTCHKGEAIPVLTWQPEENRK